MTNLQPDSITIIGNANVLWTPKIGSETQNLLDRLDITVNEKSVTRDEALAILSRCKPPYSEAEPTTGLAVGYVQSGKTMSFTTVTALARDNLYQLVIVITGVSTNLFGQSRDRLMKDLRLNDRPDRKWQHISNPANKAAIRDVLSSIFADWRDTTIAEDEQRTILITVMKNVVHLRKLIALLSGMDLVNVPALIIDDEADQAGLNTLVRASDESSTYRELIRLRNVLPDHSYLQYTATPQAPLLINIIDTLSPDFAQVLTPGAKYVGGQQYFDELPELIQVIPTAEVPTKTNVLTEPPASLLDAFRVFLIGVAVGLIEDRGSKNRSMLVHPSQETLRHAQYHKWLVSTRRNWLEILDLPETDPDRSELIQDFTDAYLDLSTKRELPPWEDIIARLVRAIRITRIEEVNAAQGKTPDIAWRDNYSFVLVGGQAMDRGFTVEGLTVTYMPRGVGVGNADTIQQRARFFGYKRDYIGLCRVYLEANARDAFKRYVEHEEDIRKHLIKHSTTGKPLSEWKRAFFLNAQLKPTRANVLDLDYMRGTYSNEWWWPTAPHEGGVYSSNAELVENFLLGTQLDEDPGDSRRTELQTHLRTPRLLLQQVYRDFLTFLRYPRPKDSQTYTGALLQIAAYLDDNPDALARVYVMSKGKSRERTLDAKNEIPTLFQGANFAGKEVVYPGDSLIKDDNVLSIQIHTLRIKTITGDVFNNVPAIAVFLPKEMEYHWLVQDKP